MRIPKPCLSVRLSVHLSVPRDKENHHSFVNISPTLVIDTSIERSSRVLQHGNPKIYYMLTSWNHLSFANISPILEIYTSMERSSRVLQHAHGKCEFYKIKVAKARIFFVRETSFSEVIYRGSVAVLFICSLSTMVATSLPAPAE